MASSVSSYQHRNDRHITVKAHRAGAIGEYHVPTVTIELNAEWPDSRNESLPELTYRFSQEATDIAEALIQCLPGGVLDRLVGRLLAYKASHFVVNHETAGVPPR
jgi:hypothetical protein